nr:MAG TPA: hypothetical protein [Caudoviricetes sp.]
MRELSKKYFVDLFLQTQWLDMDENTNESMTRKYE